MNASVSTWLNNIKTFFMTFDLNKWAHEVAGSSAFALQGAIYFGISIVTGYITKRYFKIILGALIITAVFIKSMEYLELLTINWTQVQTTSGIDTSMSISTLFSTIIESIKNNPIIFISSIVGFLIGHRLG